MGRTKRKRIRKNGRFSSVCLDSDSSVIALNQWMKANNWRNDNRLRLFLFKNTGRGLTSSKKIEKQESLIEVPYALMITYTTIENSYLNSVILEEARGKLKIHDLLSIYLVFEKHRGIRSNWKVYIDSLPKDNPPLPWLCSSEEIEKIPVGLRTKVQDRVRVFESSWERSKESINPRWKCECCEIPGYRVLTLNSFTWAYVMVNTRGVYVDPDIVRGLSRNAANNFSYILSDDPCMALCPYLDMFNHSNVAATHAELVNSDGRWLFRLITLTSTQKYEEIFISYGSHDNIKLLSEYGFFIPNNELDVMELNFSEILRTAKVSMNKKQYKFIRERQLDCELNVSVVSGLSFNLKAVLFVILNVSVMDWCPYVFNENYSEQNIQQMGNLIKPVIEFEILKLSSKLCSLRENYELHSECFKNVINYLQHRLTFIQQICSGICTH